MACDWLAQRVDVTVDVATCPTPLPVEHNALVAISPYLEWLRGFVGHELILMPSVAVLPRDEAGRLLLARHAESGLWGLIGGAVETGESPAQAAVREAREEVGLDLKLNAIVGAVGGPGYELEYANGDRVAYVSVVFEASVISGELSPDNDEVTGVRWCHLRELSGLALNDFARNLLDEIGYFGPA
jgi:8-oxo-dGTP pyrophosphatase MutT (NUDIX family)